MMFAVWYAEKNDLLPKCVANFGFIVCLEVLNRSPEDKWVFYVSIFHVYGLLVTLISFKSLCKMTHKTKL